MTAESRRRRGSDQEHRDAATRRQDSSTARPTREQAFEAFCTLLAYAAPSSDFIYTQLALPPDAKSADAYLRRHRLLRAAGIGGAWMRGKLACCTPEAWATDLSRSNSPAPKLEPVASVDNEIASALGVRARRSA